MPKPGGKKPRHRKREQKDKGDGEAGEPSKAVAIVESKEATAKDAPFGVYPKCSHFAQAEEAPSSMPWTQSPS